MSTPHRIFYICEVCFAVADEPIAGHPHPMIECDAGAPGDDCTQPVVDDAGHILTHAPRWWVFRRQPPRDELSR